ncbi:Do family serine endopeptidase [Phreatobacter stygius]|uniref:Probable periplasmic serine endoprotease DegP-like n=1 Tax=Phreatobacter stygius TaxID=1940610 RepID=A0A4D7AYZ0_9HYPH|nr:Do family serine endopeptidase [Phreatobacter stygius]QCI66559.1 Do family serine endopeptidase [Phreatobacter stygius]
MSPRLRTALYGTVAALAIGAGVLQFQSAPSNFIAPAHAQAQAQIAGLPSFADVVDRVRPAVVSVRVSRAATSEQMSFRDMPGLDDNERGMMERFMRRFGEQGQGDQRFGQGDQRFGQGERRGGQGRGPRAMAQGSGFFISADGYVVTNNHVVEGATEAELVIDGGRTVKAKVVGTDPRTDLALLKVEGSNFPFVRFAAQAPRVGDWVLAVGNPFGLGGTVTAGIVSARGRDIGSGPYDDFLQIDAAVNRGNSGGPTFNAAGEVIGVNTAIYSPSGGNVGIAFAIPSETTQTVVAALRETGTVSRGWIGVQIQPVTEEIAESLRLARPEGALVAGVQAGSPAARAELRPSDVITAVDGQPVKDARDLSRRIGTAHPGATVKLTVQRDGAERSINLTLGQIPNERQAAARGGDQPNEPRGDQSAGPQVPRLGLSLQPAGRGGKFGGSGEGLVVTEVDPSGPAAQRGVREGDIIIDVAGRAVASTRDVHEALAAARAQGRRSALIRLRSGDGQRFIAIPLNAG